MGSACSSDGGAVAAAAVASQAYEKTGSVHLGTKNLDRPGLPGSIDQFSGDSPQQRRRSSVDRHKQRKALESGQSPEGDESAVHHPGRGVVETAGAPGALLSTGGDDSDGDEPNLADLRKKVVLPDDWQHSRSRRRPGGAGGDAPSTSGSDGGSGHQSDGEMRKMGGAVGHGASGKRAAGKSPGSREAPSQARAAGSKGPSPPTSGKRGAPGRKEEFDGSTSSSSTSANLKSSAQPKARLPAEARGLVGQPRPPPADGAASKAKAPRPPSGPPETTPPGKRNLDGKPPPGAPAGAAPLKRAESGPTTSGSRAAGPAKDDFPSARSMPAGPKSPENLRRGAEGADEPSASDSPDVSANPVAVLKNRLGGKRRLGGSNDRGLGDGDDMEAIPESSESAERPSRAAPGGENVPPPPPRLRPSQLARQGHLPPAGTDDASGSGGGGDLPALSVRKSSTSFPQKVAAAQPLSPRFASEDLRLPPAHSGNPAGPSSLPAYPGGPAVPGPPLHKNSRRSDPTELLPSVVQPSRSRLYMQAGRRTTLGDPTQLDPNSPPPAIPEGALIGLHSTSFSTPMEDERFSRALAAALPQLAQHLDPDAPPPPPPRSSRSFLKNPNPQPQPPKQSRSFSNGTAVALEPAGRNGRRLSLPLGVTSEDDEAAIAEAEAKADPAGKPGGGSLVNSAPPGWSEGGAAAGEGAVPHPPLPHASSLNQDAMARLRNRRLNAAPSVLNAAAAAAAAATASATAAAAGGSVSASDRALRAPRATDLDGASPKPSALAAPEPPRPMTAADLKKESALAQRASEVEIVLRLGSLSRDSDVEKAAAAVDRMLDLLTTIDAASKRLDSENSALYGYLLHHMAAQQAAEQKAAEKDRSPFAAAPPRGGAVNVSVLAHTHPQTTEAPVWAQADDALGGARRVEELARSVGDLRLMLRIKVQDKGDLQTAKTALKEAKGFFEELAKHAQTRGAGQAEVLASLRALSSTPRPHGRGAR